MLNEQKCEAWYRRDCLSKDEQQSLLLELSDWQIMERDGIPQLEKVFKFKNYKQAWAFSNKVSELARRRSFTTLRFYWSGGKVTPNHLVEPLNQKGLHKNDFICTSRCDVFAVSE
ncbi:4a-hydroxytetrahydrobiopterin dehydratase [Vibrio lentus]|nr:4a-hydroxytetrahydrobiopterin dehydratase [Vibrio lentus]